MAVSRRLMRLFLSFARVPLRSSAEYSVTLLVQGDCTRPWRDSRKPSKAISDGRTTDFHSPQPAKGDCIVVESKAKCTRSATPAQRGLGRSKPVSIVAQYPTRY